MIGSKRNSEAISCGSCSVANWEASITLPLAAEGSHVDAVGVSNGIHERTQAASSSPEPIFSARQHAGVADDVYASVSHERG